MREQNEGKDKEIEDLRSQLKPPSFAKVIKYDILMSFLILVSSSLISNLFLSFK